MNGKPRLLRIQVSYRYRIPLLYLSGELDRDSAGELREVIQQELASEPKGLLLECSELVYIDSGGLSLLFGTVQSLKGGGELGIVAPNAGVRKIIEMTGLVDRSGVRVYADLASVKAAPPLQWDHVAEITPNQGKIADARVRDVDMDVRDLEDLP